MNVKRGNVGCRASDSCFLFHSTSLDKAPFTDEDKKVSADMVRMWTDFAKQGDPTPRGDPKWLPIKLPGKDSKHLEITADGPTLKTDSAEYRKRADFWERVWVDHPQTLHWKKSPTFKNTKMYRKMSDATAKEEL